MNSDRKSVGSSDNTQDFVPWSYYETSPNHTLLVLHQVLNYCFLSILGMAVIISWSKLAEFPRNSEFCRHFDIIYNLDKPSPAEYQGSHALMIQDHCLNPYPMS